MWPGTSFCSCPPAQGAAGLQQHRGVVSLRSTRNRGGGERSPLLMAQVKASEKHSPACNVTKAGAAPRWCTAWHALVTCSFSWWQHLPSTPPASHLTSAESARTRFPGQRQPLAFPPDALGMQAPWEALAQQSLLSLCFGCGNYPRRSNKNPGKVQHTASTQHLPWKQNMFQSAHSITGTSNQ